MKSPLKNSEPIKKKVIYKGSNWSGEPSLKRELRQIFPNGDEESFKYYLRVWKGNTKNALYGYGLWKWEMPKYKKEIKQLEKRSKIWYNWYKKNDNRF